MRTHTNDFKNGIVQIGKRITSKIIYELDGDTIELSDEELNFVSLNYKGNILKSVMKQLNLDSNIDIPIGTIINYQFGLLIDEDYEYINYGNFIVNKSEKQEDVNSYKITCYDKMLYSMVEYEDLGITYPITIRDYITAICTKLGLTFANQNTTFANYNRQIASELYLDNGGNALGYTFRDVLDQLAEVTASTICINDNDELEIRYITETNDVIDENYFKDTKVNFGEKYGPINSVVLSRSAETDNVVIKDDTSIAQNGLCELKIIDNQIMNWNDRSDYLPDIFSKLGGLQYYINDYASYGIMYYDLCDRYTAQIGENYYSCVMFNDEIISEQGLEENVYTEMPISSETDYKMADSTDRKINGTNLIVDKQNKIISQIVSSVGDDGEVTAASIITAINNDTSQVSIEADKINLNGAVTANNNFMIKNDGSVEINNGNIEVINPNEQLNSNLIMVRTSGDSYANSLAGAIMMPSYFLSKYGYGQYGDQLVQLSARSGLTLQEIDSNDDIKNLIRIGYNWMYILSNVGPNNTTVTPRHVFDVDSLGNTTMNNVVVSSIRTKNLFNKNAVLQNYELIGSGSYAGGTSPQTGWYVSDFIEVEPNTKYYLTKSSSGSSNCFYNSSKTFVTSVSASSGVITIPNNSNIKYMRFNGVMTDLDNVQFEKGETQTTLSPYQNLNAPAYEEGTWTPEYLNCTVEHYSSMTARYVKLGHLVIATLHDRPNIHNVTGNALIGGLPYPAQWPQTAGSCAVFMPIDASTLCGIQVSNGIGSTTGAGFSFTNPAARGGQDFQWRDTGTSNHGNWLEVTAIYWAA